ncbi:MAG: ribose-5-phosphate isomerase [Dehalococcoidia bacterium]|nr:ribose-5-phosphate isomerase [Dehalococcoidia bacterium]
MKISIGSDHGGFELKKKLIHFLQSEKHNITDVGAFQFDPNDDYPDFSVAVSNLVADKSVEKGIILCGSGIGAVIASNKVKGVRAGLCHDTYSARQGVEHDAMNVLCIGAKIVDHSIVENILSEFLEAEFLEDDKYSRRLKKVVEIEQSSE